ncbi:MAG TPA: efflux RND transporter periplasmic adaptor subunit [Candidatus Paceibacterota bacterium]|nr:efflux RND transporter periplasmic adaptor subunit [Candidatus Paceibacterota bacterium]
MYKKIFDIIKANRKKTAAILILLVVAGYYGYKKFFTTTNGVRYVTGVVTKGTIVASVSATGQTSASNQLDLKPKVSGTITKILATNGQEVAAGTIIAKIDAIDAEKAVRDASANLKSAQLALQKLTQPADQLAITQSENALAQAVDAKKGAEEDLKKAGNEGYNTVASTFIDLSSTVTGLHDILYSQHGLDAYTSSISEYNALNDSYSIADSAYQRNLLDYKNATLYTDNAQVSMLIDETYSTAKTIATVVKNVSSAIQSKISSSNQTRDTKTDTHIATLSSYTDKLNADLQALINSKNALRSDTDTIASAVRTIAEKTQSLAKLRSGADPLDVQSQKLSVQQRANALADAQEKLADYTIRAPFDCVIASIPVKVADAVSSGTTIATLITKQRIAEITLNEVDVAKAKVGQQVTLSFDAIDGLNIAGAVSEIDSVGTISQGVVTYAVKISFDAQDERVKPGMSVSAAIITDVKQEALLIPSSAIKNKGMTKSVELYNNGSPTTVTVETGISNDTRTQIISGLSEGDTIVVQTINSSAAAATTGTQQGGLRFPGLGGRG